jgi:hypothetical protein
MKRSSILALLTGTALVALTGFVGLQPDATAGYSAAVSDEQAAMLFGGACEDGHKYKVEGNCGQTDDNKPYYGCRYKSDRTDDGAGGSYVEDGTNNCGVSECGTVKKLKECS